MISILERLMYEVSNLFLPPVLLIIVALFFYSIVQSGVFFAEMYKRKQNSKNYNTYLKDEINNEISGYPIMKYLSNKTFSSIEDIEMFTFKKLENTSLVTRVTPMLGLVATMIPMGPALKSLSSGNIQGISDNLIIAFAAVIFALLTSSITYTITSVRRRWYANEVKDIIELQKAKNESA
ncbi:MAG: hypothetical protein MJK08_03245 [Campylobacterales bacterium]|nr:hypothetical protein [Campylobacterales bacterium]NQY53225.1 hypothetical protein [Campylobacteraceae bacterium]